MGGDDRDLKKHLISQLVKEKYFEKAEEIAGDDRDLKKHLAQQKKEDQLMGIWDSDQGTEVYEVGPRLEITRLDDDSPCQPITIEGNNYVFHGYRGTLHTTSDQILWKKDGKDDIIWIRRQNALR